MLELQMIKINLQPDFQEWKGQGPGGKEKDQQRGDDPKC